MNNFVIAFKRFIANKNVVTVILVIAGLAILYWGYDSSIKKQTNPISVPVAKEKINPKTVINADMVEYVNVAGSMIGENVITSPINVIGRATNLNVTVPKGSVFYSEWLIDEDKLPGNWIEQLDYEAGELGYYMDTDIESTLGNNVLPNTYIDIYMKAFDENGTVMFGKLLKNIEVLVVHDSSGNDVFGDVESEGIPSKIGFAVSQDIYTLLKKAEEIDVEMVMAPRGITVPANDYVIVTSATLRDYIDAQTITVGEDAIAQETPNQGENNPPQQ